MFHWTNASEKQRAKILLMMTAVLHGLFPILMHAGTHVLPPLYFAAVYLLLASLFPLLMLAGRGNIIRTAIPRHVLRDVVLVALLNLTIPTALIAIGTRMTSGINTALLGQAEMFFTFLVCNILLRQKTHAVRLVGALAVFLGTVLILFQSSRTLNTGDMLIVLATAFYPFGNLVSKRLLESLDVLTILFLRSLVAGLLLLGLSAIFEHIPSAIHATIDGAWWLIVLQAFFVLFLSKFLWYEGLKALSVSRATFIVSSAPAWSLVFAVAFLGEVPDLAQLIGFGITLIGIFLLTARFMRQAPEAAWIETAI
ncbi:MAG: hypothetical protein RIQ56_751 [Candidatus Parcubacteria bacterium]|jgi:drug/metabolite transporter (DMT)-like permease